MPKAILELEMPESCYVCPCKGTDVWGAVRCRLIHIKSDKYCGMAEGYANKRRPDCPLKLVEGEEVEQTNVKCRYCNSENVKIIARGTESILYKCKACKMQFAKLNINTREVEP